MGVCLDISTIGDANTGILLQYPRLVWDIVFPQYSNLLTTRNEYSPEENMGSGLLHRNSFEPEPVTFKESLGEYWHGLHYLMCQEVWCGSLPDAFLIDGGEFVGDVDVGYGPARVFTAKEVEGIARSVLRKTRRDLTTSFDASKMLDFDIYPQIWDNENALATCLERFSSLQAFLKNAVDNQLGMVLYLSRRD